MLKPTPFNPVMQSPLHHFGLVAKQTPLNDTKGVWANEIPLLGYIALRGSALNTAFVSAASSALGVALPTEPCRMATASWGSVLWLSPDEWLLLCSRTERPALQLGLETALAGIHSQVVDNSGGYTTVLLQGQHAEDVLRHCTVYDTHQLTENKVVGSTFGKTSALFFKHALGYQLVFRRSFADYIWLYLERSAQPYGFGIAQLNIG